MLIYKHPEIIMYTILIVSNIFWEIYIVLFKIKHVFFCPLGAGNGAVEL